MNASKDERTEKMAVDAAVSSSSPTEDTTTADGLINASGHKQELDRNFNIISIISYAITSGNCWVSLGGTIVRIL